MKLEALKDWVLIWDVRNLPLVTTVAPHELPRLPGPASRGGNELHFPLCSCASVQFLKWPCI